MIEQVTSNERLKVEVAEAPFPSKISARDDFDPEESPKKTTVFERPTVSEVNRGFLFGFVWTLLIGSFHYGNLSWLS